MNSQNTSEVKLIGLKYPELKRYIDNLSMMKEKLKDDGDKSLKYSITLVERQFKMIAPLFINKMHINNVLRKYIKDNVENHLDAYGKIKDVNKLASIIIKDIENHYNKLILSSKREDSKHNRIVEKGELVRFFRSNADQLRLFLELLNLLRDIKLTAVKGKL